VDEEDGNVGMRVENVGIGAWEGWGGGQVTWGGLGGGHKQGHNERGAPVNWEVFRVVKAWSLARIASPEGPQTPLNVN
jgi:hypothetical protein